MNNILVILVKVMEGFHSPSWLVGSNATPLLPPYRNLVEAWRYIFKGMSSQPSPLSLFFPTNPLTPKTRSFLHATLPHTRGFYPRGYHGVGCVVLQNWLDDGSKGGKLIFQSKMDDCSCFICNRRCSGGQEATFFFRQKSPFNNEFPHPGLVP